ncbi:MAG: hypothetical protein L3J70_07370 [Gammaproteobacteria bacterium]|nr:hypothetical protein [Gammaproteobacteria bacterium]
MFEIETCADMIYSQDSCEVLVMTEQNEYFEFMGSANEYDEIDFEGLGFGRARNVALPPMFCS